MGPTTSTDGTYAVSLPFEAASAARARRSLDDWVHAEAERFDPILDDCLLVVSELVGNAVRHAAPLPDGTMRVEFSPVGTDVEISVTDGGSESKPVPMRVEPTALQGRGLALVEAVSHRWWVEDANGGSTVHATLSTDRLSPGQLIPRRQ